jgi:Helix-turn-helix domain
MAVSVGEVTLSGCSFVTATALTRPLARGVLLARTFGCARVVLNDGLRARQDAYAAGERISDTQVQARVVTLAKTTPQRQWLGEVASVALVQACQDARPCVPELVRLPVGHAQRPQGGASQVPVS